MGGASMGGRVFLCQNTLPPIYSLPLLSIGSIMTINLCYLLLLLACFYNTKAPIIKASLVPEVLVSPAGAF